jgi:hypothetical protein
MSETSNKSPKTLKDHLKAFGGALFMVGLTLLLLEGMVRFTDPWGLSYFNDLIRMGNKYFVADPVRGYILPDGSYKFSYWTVTVENGARVTPATNSNADCSLIMLGDSVTMGHGVDDDETWINHLAQVYPDVQFVNTGLTSYNSTNVLGSKRAFPNGDAYVYLMIDNDMGLPLSPNPEAYPEQNPTNLPYLVRYVSFILRYEENTAQNTLRDDDAGVQRFLSEVDEIMADGDTWLVTLDNSLIAERMQNSHYDVTLYLYPSYRISRVDAHLNAEGNRLFAQQFVPLIAEIRDERCNS